jgi:hypothetical protein
MLARKNSGGQIIKPFVTGGTLIALTCGFRVITAALDDLGGLTRWALDAVWPAQLAHRLLTLNIIDQLLAVALQRRTPVLGRDMGYRQFTTSSNLRPWNPT